MNTVALRNHCVGDECPGAHAEMGSRMTMPNQLATLHRALAEFYDDDGAARWLTSPHRLLGGQIPREWLRVGGFAEVWALIDQLRTGAYV